MKPKNIIILRHGQSEGNVDKNIMAVKPDYALQLTQLGRQQALKAGEDILKFLKTQPNFKPEASVQFYISPFWRSRQTYQLIKKSFPNGKMYEDPRLREQEWGHLRDMGQSELIRQERDLYGHFYYRLPDGESCADVFDRAGDALHTVYRDFNKQDFPETAIFVCHGMQARILLMRWLHWTVEEFELMANPKNCEFFILQLQQDGKYKLITEHRKHELEHKYQYDWSELA